MTDEGSGVNITNTETGEIVMARESNQKLSVPENAARAKSDSKNLTWRFMRVRCSECMAAVKRPSNFAVRMN